MAEFTREKYVELYDFCYSMDRHSSDSIADLLNLLKILDNFISREKLEEILGPDYLPFEDED